MLHADDVGVQGIDAPRRRRIVGPLVLADVEGDLGRIVMDDPGIGHGHGLDDRLRVGGLQGAKDIMGEGGDATAARREVSQQNNMAGGLGGHGRGPLSSLWARTDATHLGVVGCAKAKHGGRFPGRPWY